MALVLALEALYLALRKRVPGFRLRLLYHVWVANLAVLLGLRQIGSEYQRLWQITAASGALLSTLVIFALVAVVGFIAYGFKGIGKFAQIFFEWDLSLRLGPMTFPAAPWGTTPT